MIAIHLDQSAPEPLYRQIVDHVRLAVAAGRLQPGERLPTVRELAASLAVNPGTVGRAYLELERERLIATRRGAGTTVSSAGSDVTPARLRQARLESIAGDAVIEALGLGYRPEELEAAFQLHLARWREERNAFEPRARGSIAIVASHDLALNMLVNRMQERSPATSVQVSYAGSLGGLIALQQGRARLAGIHLLDEESGEYNRPYVRHLLPGREVAILHLACRVQGLMVAAGNPKGLHDLADLGRPDVRFINRQRGSGTRVLLDMHLRRQGIAPAQVHGYETERDTHLAVAAALANGEADAALGIEAAAAAHGLGFLPLLRERYDLVMTAVDYRGEALAPLVEILRSPEFQRAVQGVPGYDTADTGAVALCQ